MAVIALVLLWAAASEPPEAMSRARRAYDLARAGEFEPAVAELREAARIAPRNPLYRSALGGILEKQGKLEEAVAAFAAAVRLDEGNAALRARLESVSLEWGAELARARRYRAGLELARETAARFPESARAHLMLGLFESRNQQNLAAVEAYRRALTLDPDSADASVGLGIAQTSAGLLEDAEATFQAGLKKFPRDAMHRQSYGVLLVRLAESGAAPAERAIKMLASALEIDASLAEAHYQLGKLLLAGGDAAAAAGHFEAAARNGLGDSRLHYATARALRRLGKDDAAGKHLQLFRERKAAEQRQPVQP